jgi:hypothetical protein
MELMLKEYYMYSVVTHVLYNFCDMIPATKKENCLARGIN